MPTTRNCCGCFTLQTGTCILAIYLIIVNVLNFTSLGYNFSISGGSTYHFYSPYPGYVVAGLDILMAAIGLIGATRRSAALVKVFAVWLIVRIVAMVGFAVANFYFLYTDTQFCDDFGVSRGTCGEVRSVALPSFIVGLVISVLFGIYFAIVVWSYYRELLQGDQHPNIELGYTAAPVPPQGAYPYHPNQAPQQPWGGNPQYGYAQPPPQYGQEYQGPPQYVQK
ncbi:hypothetical protein HK097_007841 [Rhizophlyctis rosea]|uniref:Uncharacterized protein n=1 Tax=Rhizophlyctis rosea TaxID=64517 RepID=A0AAD5SE75_9FUNG|nr:hypothetical protein HK097_007841 [Rhizophlyctis rosea]